MLLFPSAQNVVSEYIESAIILDLVAGGISFIISLILCSIFFSKIKLIIKPICGGLIDKTTGALLGAINGILLSLALFMVIIVITSEKHFYEYENLYNLVKSVDKDKQAKWLKNSNSYHIMDSAIKSGLKISYIRELLKKTDLKLNINLNDHFKTKEPKHPNTSDEDFDTQLNEILDDE
jgi:uncharacterized membrane protein required for colicin V production